MKINAHVAMREWRRELITSCTCMARAREAAVLVRRTLIDEDSDKPPSSILPSSRGSAPANADSEPADNEAGNAADDGHNVGVIFMLRRKRPARINHQRLLSLRGSFAGQALKASAKWRWRDARDIEAPGIE